MLKIALVGATGRMGARVAKQIIGHDNCELVAVLAHEDSNWQQAAYQAVLSSHGVACDTDNLHVQSDFAYLKQADVVIDFSLAAGLPKRVRAYRNAGKPVVICTTGLTASEQSELRALSTEIPVVFAANTSVGINLLANLVATASATLGEQADIEILEAHHRKKVDAPSGTALLLGEAAANARNQTLADVKAFDRNGADMKHVPGTIGFATLRGGDIVGEHTVYLMVGGERLELTHRVASRDTFADGAIRAAQWLADKSSGFYSMKDVLGLDEKR